MKKFLILLLICIISLSLFACDTPPTDTNVTDTDTDISNPTNKEYIKASTSTKNTVEEYYTKIGYDFGSYNGTDMPASSGTFFKVVKSYDKFISLFKNGNFLEEDVFDENYILIIRRNYPSYPASTDVGFSNFRIENEKPYIDLKSYYFALTDISPAEYRVTECYLIPNTVICEEGSFAKLNITGENRVLSYNFVNVNIDGLPLKNNEAIIFNEIENFESFKREHNISFYSQYKEAIYLIFYENREVITYNDLSLNGNKLTLLSNITGESYNKLSIVEIPKSSFASLIPENVELEINYTNNCSVAYKEKITEEEWLNAFNNYYEDNYTENVIFSYDEGNKTYIKNGTFWHTKDKYAEALDETYKFYQDCANECYYEIENQIWNKKDGILKNDYLAFMGYNIEPLKNAYSQMSINEYSNIYTLNEYNEFKNIKIKITDGRIVYISFMRPSSYQANTYETFIIYRYDFNKTEIILPQDGEIAQLSKVAINRAEKVTINLDYHPYGDELLNKPESVDKTKHYAGYICINQNGNEYIAYAPNVHSYYTAITYNEKSDLSELYGKIRQIEYKYFNDSPEYTKIDIIEIGNVITIYFPDFNSYFECQEYMLDTLSQIEAVKSIDVGYIEAQDTNTMNFDTYETIVLSYQDRFETDWLCNSYEDLEFACRNMKMPENITKETFNEYYVFVVNSYDYRNKVSDARLIGNTVYLTLNRYYTPNTLADAIDRSCSFVVLVPKAELGDLPEIVTVKTLLVHIIKD